MLDWIEYTDQALLLFINANHLHWLDVCMYGVSNKWIWIPLYAILLFWLWQQYKTKIYWLLACVFVLILFADQGSNLCKDSVKRYRPCHNLALQSKLHLVQNKCGGQFGFFSAHAANSMALSMFVVLLLIKKKPWLPWMMFAYCFLVSYSRVYLAQHYPLDIVGGWLWGATIAVFIFRYFKRISIFNSQ